MVRLASSSLVVLNLKGLGEEDRGRALPFANLPAVLLRLRICHPPAIARLEGAHLHTEDQDVNSPVAMSCGGIEGSLRASALFGVPIAAPRLDALLQEADDPVREFLTGIAARDFTGGAAERHGADDKAGLRCRKAINMRCMSSNPVHPDDRYIPTEEEERIVRERLKTYERDKRDAEPWEDVKQRILAKLQRPQPR